MATGIHVHLYHTTAALLVPVALDPAMACRTTQGDGVLWCAHGGLLHTARQQCAPPGAPRRRRWGAALGYARHTWVPLITYRYATIGMPSCLLASQQ